MSFDRKTFHFNTRKEIEDSLWKTIGPLEDFYKNRKGRLNIGSHGTVYKKDTRNIEAFLRILWGLGSFWAQNPSEKWLDIYIKGIVAGTDPTNEDYFGDVTDYDQLLVEMTSIVVTFMLNKEKIWDRLTAKEQTKIANWLRQINEHNMPANNWHFFRILVNVCLKKMGVRFSQEKLDEDLELINSFYVNNGWYYDGIKTQRDYYIPWAFHYYGLIYSVFMSEDDPVRSKLFKERAAEFAKSFAYMFDKNGNAIPFGRSLTYRFAQCAFWSALVFADVEALPWDQIKGLYVRNMESWYNKEIFTTDGILSVGYYYQNLIMAEGYNAPGSPYWALKSYLLLAVPDDHPFWKAVMKETKLSEEKYLNVSGRSMYVHTGNSNHAQMFPFGQSINYQPHCAAKYSKFVYSSVFGFSVPKSTYYYYEGAFDNILAVSEDGLYFRPKENDEMFEVNEDYLTYKWKPYSDVLIYSTIIPCGDYHVRIHEINSERNLIACEGGFSNLYDKEERIEDSKSAKYISKIGTSEIFSVKGFDKGDVIRPEPNTNLLYERTLLPILTANLSKGKHILISIVGGIPKSNTAQKPDVKREDNQVVIITENKKISVNINNKF